MQNYTKLRNYHHFRANKKPNNHLIVRTDTSQLSNITNCITFFKSEISTEYSGRAYKQATASTSFVLRRLLVVDFLTV